MIGYINVINILFIEGNKNFHYVYCLIIQRLNLQTCKNNISIACAIHHQARHKNQLVIEVIMWKTVLKLSRYYSSIARQVTFTLFGDFFKKCFNRKILMLSKDDKQINVSDL